MTLTRNRGRRDEKGRYCIVDPVCAPTVSRHSCVGAQLGYGLVMARCTFAAFYESESKGKLRLKDNILGVGGGGQRAEGAAGRGPAGARAVRR